MTTQKRLLFSYGILAVLLAVLFAANLFWGSVALTPEAVLSALLGRGQDALSVRIITQLRLPRAVMVVLLGAALSAAGYLLQTFFANPIAGPFVMGISSGAKLAVALVMVVFLNQGLLTSSLTLILAAFAGALTMSQSVAQSLNQMFEPPPTIMLPWLGATGDWIRFPYEIPPVRNSDSLERSIFPWPPFCVLPSPGERMSLTICGTRSIRSPAPRTIMRSPPLADRSMCRQAFLKARYRSAMSPPGIGSSNAGYTGTSTTSSAPDNAAGNSFNNAFVREYR